MSVHWPNLRTVHSLVFDFDGVFTDNKVYVFEDGREAVRCDRGDGLAFDLLRGYCRLHAIELRLLILSKEINPVVAARARKLHIDCLHGRTDKVEALQQQLRTWFPELQNPLQGVIYFGNDLNDIAVMRTCGFSVAPADAHPLVKREATITLPEVGGAGFLRSAIEGLIGAQDMSTSDLIALLRPPVLAPTNSNGT